MYLTVSIRPSHKESPTELFIKKFFFRLSPHFSAFEPPNKNPPKRVHLISTAPSLETTPGDTRNQLLITNFLSFNPFLIASQITASKISHCCSNFKLESHKFFTLGQPERQQNYH